jgi:hypothetical protein
LWFHRNYRYLIEISIEINKSRVYNNMRSLKKKRKHNKEKFRRRKKKIMTKIEKREYDINTRKVKSVVVGVIFLFINLFSFIFVKKKTVLQLKFFMMDSAHSTF